MMGLFVFITFMIFLSILLYLRYEDYKDKASNNSVSKERFSLGREGYGEAKRETARERVERVWGSKISQEDFFDINETSLTDRMRSVFGVESIKDIPLEALEHIMLGKKLPPRVTDSSGKVWVFDESSLTDEERAELAVS